MEKLTDTQRQRVTKMADARIVQKLLQAGMSVDKVELLDRKGLLDAMAELVLAGKEPAAAVNTGMLTAYDPELERQKF